MRDRYYTLTVRIDIWQRDTKNSAKRHSVSRDTGWAPLLYRVLGCAIFLFTRFLVVLASLVVISTAFTSSPTQTLRFASINISLLSNTSWVLLTLTLVANLPPSCQS